jgi:hypothetical protein
MTYTSKALTYGNQGQSVAREPSSYALTATIPSLSGTISGGTTNLTTKQYSAVLTSATTLTCDGPVEWQVVEYL